ncbi:MAG: apolipoprotein N-acyltransferase [Hyphomicrobiales bacterium]
MNALQAICHSIVLLSGWRVLALCFVLGAITAAGLAPLHLTPVLWVIFPLFVFTLDGAVPNAEKRGLSKFMPAFWRGCWFGFGYFIAGLWWLGSAFLVDADMFAWLLPLAVIGLPLCLAIFFGLAALVARMFWTGGARRIFALAASFAAFEWLRGTILSGFPWNTLGVLLAPNDVMMQGVAIFGLYTYGFFAVLIFSSPALLLGDASVNKSKGRIFLLVICLAIGLGAYGLLRLSAADEAHVAGVQLRIIQPNISQKDKFKPEKSGEILERYISMSTRSTKPDDLGLLSTTHLIWPESAFPFLLTEQPDAISQIANMLPVGTTLLTGAARATPRTAGNQRRAFYNSLYVINHDGEIRDAYDKMHLVPFGEYLPFEEHLKNFGLSSLVQVPGGFSPGAHRRILETGNAPPFIPLICYEVLFPGQVSAKHNTQSAEWILNVTNDAWFGITSGPYQHFHQTRLRAVEEGLPVIRAANNGISAVIDGYGRVEQSLKLGQSGIINSKIPVKVVLPVEYDIKKFIFWALIIFSIFAAARGILAKHS